MDRKEGSENLNIWLMSEFLANREHLPPAREKTALSDRGKCKIFLEVRIIRVTVNGCLSKAAGLGVGGPQSTVSGPILWSIFSEGLIKDIKATADKDNVENGMIADDLTI